MYKNTVAILRFRKIRATYTYRDFTVYKFWFFAHFMHSVWRRQSGSGGGGGCPIKTSLILFSWNFSGTCGVREEIDDANHFPPTTYDIGSRLVRYYSPYLHHSASQWGSNYLRRRIWTRRSRTARKSPLAGSPLVGSVLLKWSFTFTPWRFRVSDFPVTCWMEMISQLRRRRMGRNPTYIVIVTYWNKFLQG